MMRCKNAFSIFLVLCVVINTVTSRTIKNGIVGDPTIRCEDRAISIHFHTQDSFTGKVYVKGKYDDPNCINKFLRNVRTQMAYTVELGKCGMHRLRQVSPRGMNFGVVVIVSFHPIFITSIDRAYNIRCMYAEPEERVRVDLEVSMLPTTPLNFHTPHPSCEYTVRRDGPHGPLVSFANVGDTVYHVWQCRGADDLGILVKSCYVGDANNQVSVVDDRGCVSDELLLDQLTYDIGLNRAHSASKVFKYADSNQLFFTCQIGMCYKQTGSCAGVTPPSCKEDSIGSVIRATRSVPVLADYEVDVATPELTIMDIDKQFTANQIADSFRLPTQPHSVIDYPHLLDELSACNSPIVIVTFIGLCLCLSGATWLVTYCWYRRKRSQQLWSSHKIMSNANRLFTTSGGMFG